MKRIVIVGHPLGHSLSPIMHNAAFSAMGLDTELHYDSLQLRPDELSNLIDDIKNEIILGANITIPYKTEIMKHLSLIDEESKALGAVNTLYVDDGDVIGSNTDIFGFREALREHGVRVRGLCASILGAGGAARAVAHALVEDGIESLEILCRTRQKAEDLVSMVQRFSDIQVSLNCSSSGDYQHHETDLLVNCTPVGMRGHSLSETPLSSSYLTEGLVVMDLVYNPLQTRLLTEAQRTGCKTIAGIEMLVKQGAASFELWTGRKPPTAVMKEAVLDALGGM
ncbi:MAG: shikimate dehydrogenase [Promethearchaeota archaeon]